MGTIAAAVFGYRTWDYIEHDNEFCLSCHLMVEPYEEFAESAHRGLGCKACHKPDLVARSQMGLTQVIENPDSLGIHAEVPNDKCESCHVEGDPDAWRQIAASTGHRVHFESEDSAVAGLQCVGCHSSSVHEFAATDQTCGQSGCHEDTRVKLGTMGDFTIHCVACHEFTRPTDLAADAPDPELQPRGAECLSCHAMRRLVGDIPDTEPHGGACGACHNPHEQTTPADAVATCGEAGCHARSDTTSPMHRGLQEGVLEQCTLCHAAHDSELVEPDCVACHVDPDARAVPPPPPGDDTRPTVLLDRLLRFLGPAPASAQTAGADEQQEAPADSGAQGETFTHGQHGTVACVDCHSSERSHGEVTVHTTAECRSCHHSNPVAGDCVACHPAVRLRGEAALSRVLTVPIATAAASPRILAFDHGPHERQTCIDCHAGGGDRPATTSGCGDCHDDHHTPETKCSACHGEAPQSAHPIEAVHLTCGGSGCHAAERFPATPARTRSTCLACHQSLEEHEPEQGCAECHALGRAGQAAVAHILKVTSANPVGGAP